MTAEELAEKFHDTYEALAPVFRYKTRAGGAPLEETGEDYRNLMIAVCRVVMRDVESANAPQALAHDRNAWQRRLGILLTLVENYVVACKPASPAALLDAAYRAVNTNPRSGNLDDPHADVATLSVRLTLEAALAAGLVSPGPNAPEWMFHHAPTLQADDDEATPRP